MKRNMLILAAVAAVGAMALPVHAASLSAANWQEKAFYPGGTEQIQAGAVTQSGSGIVGTVPTDATDWAYSSGGGQGYNAIEHLNAFQGSLVGDLSGKAGISTTFSLYNNNISNGAAFTNSDFGGELNGSNNELEQVLVYLRGTVSNDPGGSAYGDLSEWWYSPTADNVTGLTNGGPATLTADLSDLAGWSDIGGLKANSSPAETTAFEAMLKNVSQAGLSFGSGNYYSDGFGFNSSVGGTGSATVSAFTETAAVPLPAAVGPGLLLLGGAGLFGVIKRRRKQSAWLTNV